MSGPAPVITPVLSPNDWLRLLKELELFANSQLHLHRWRGLPGGVPPDGFDAPSLAAEVIAEYLNLLHGLDPSAGRLVGSAALQTDLRWRIRRAVDRLRRRRENYLLSNEPDLAPLLLPDGHTITPVEACLSDDLAPDELLIQKEDTRLRADVQQQFLKSLDAYPVLQEFLQKLLAAEAHPNPQHEPLTLSWRAIDNFRKRLRRRFHRFRIPS